MGEMLMIMGIIAAMGVLFVGTLVLIVGRQDPLIRKVFEETFLG
jgi:hypothetical protein